MRILAVTHSPDAGPERFEDIVAAAGHELVPWDICEEGAPRRDLDAVMVFGGDQNVGEEAEHPWLEDEYAALRAWVANRTPLLGICLGAQTLAHAFGARVAKRDEALAGFYETELTDAGAADPVLGVLPRRFEAFNGNGYAFEIPADGVELAHGPGNQAFRIGDRAWAVQFHPEIRRDHVLRWFEHDAPRPREEIAAELDEKLAGWQELGERLCLAFLAVSSR
jgi:GMP synthase (glutamine-hydrolysing)